ncbi:molecular chaperone DnaJ [Theileria orientalis strain Shintoku]|uniref:Molecular chaperone DnaJ n=1 Tax=Theileria orientalis strain Shintoku TaxID=869250 RepID=J4D8U6_THEOR|nr:molecular chaperone DnaJ [Theileria orientalis strain Shintoku]BAM41015.1 molecular chaperone DnaJ [Theileria orientalis strain Shintoku]|eukprot:XP_009691316.1 molecular chaperone DnaJ [Theileria orientalis strain Shintoku]
MDLELDDFDYYDVLNLSPNATQEEIKTNYRNLIRLWHPDKHSSTSDSAYVTYSNGQNEATYRNVSIEPEDPLTKKRETAFTKIQKAYSVLSDPVLRSQYDKYGQEGSTLAKLIMNEKTSERSVYSIPEDLSEDGPKQEISSIEKNNEFVSRRVFLLLRDRYQRELKMLPFQVVTNYTFNARSDLFSDDVMFKKRKDDKYSSQALMPSRYLYLTGVTLDNSVELLYNKYRFGVTLSAVLARGTFGNLLSRIYMSKELSDTLELRVSADTGNFFTNRVLLLSLKKKFSETFWSTAILTLSDRLMPNLYAVFHKNLNNKHSFELTLTNGVFLDYSYLKVLNRHTKVNLKVVATPDNMGVEMRTKTLNVFGSTLGAVVRLCLMKGLSVEWFFRTFLESNYLGIMKAEYRLCLNNNKVLLVLKGIVNNSKVVVPVLLYRGDENQAIYLVSSLTALTLLMPLVATAARNLYDNVCRMSTKREGDNVLLDRLNSIIEFEESVYRNPLRNNFYATFPQFFRKSYAYYFTAVQGDLGLYECKHIKYYQYPPLQSGRWDRGSGESDSDAKYRPGPEGNEPTFETSREDDLGRKIAADENNKLLNIARSTYLRELEKKGMLVLLALYGHPTVLDYVSRNHKSIYFNTRSYSPREDVVAEFLSRSGARKHFDPGFNAARCVFNVTNVVMSKVTDSTLYMSGRNKENLIGFYNPCKNLGIAPKLLIM